MGVVCRHADGDHELGEDEHVAEIDRSDHLDPEQFWEIAGKDREQQVVDGGDDPPAEQLIAFFALEFQKLAVGGNFFPVEICFRHGLSLLLLRLWPMLEEAARLPVAKPDVTAGHSRISLKAFRRPGRATV